VIGGRQGQQIGPHWRLAEGPWPTEGSDVQLLLQCFKGGGWTTVLTLHPDGTIALA
jgi:hypothetical protein